MYKPLQCLAVAVCLIAVSSLSHGVTLQPGGSPTTGDANLRFWLDASNINTLWQDTGGTSPVIAVDQEVQRWDDLSGNAFNVTQTNTDWFPQYKPASLNGNSTLYFDNDALSRANDIGVSGNADRTVIAVWTNAVDTGQNYQHVLHFGHTGTSEAYGPSAYRGGGNDRIGNHYWGNGYDTSVDGSANPTVAVSMWNGTANSDSWWVNGTDVGVHNRGALNTGTTQLQVGSRLNPSTEGIRGNIAEVIIYDTLLTPLEQAQVGLYLTSKWGLSTSYTLPDSGTRTWDGVANGNWDDLRWLPPGTPDATLIADIGPNAPDNTVTVNGNFAAHTVNLTNNGQLIIGAGNTLEISTDINAAVNTVAMQAGSTLRTLFGGGAVGTLTTAGDATIDVAGTLSVSGSTYNDGGVAATLTKQGPGTLALDNTSGTGVIAAATTFRVEAGTLQAAGADPLGGASNVILDGGTARLTGAATLGGVAPTGALGTWTFDLDTADDSSANLHHGVLSGGSYTSDSPLGAIGGRAIDLTTGNAYVLVDTDNNPTADPNQDVFDLDVLTVATWVKGWPDGDWEPFISKRGEGGQGWQLRRHGGDADRTSWTLRGVGDEDWHQNTSPVEDGDWHHLVATYTSGDRRLYVDGVLAGSSTHTGAINDTAHRLVFGARNNSAGDPNNIDNYSHVKLDDIYIYDSVLDAGQVAELYGAGVVTFGALFLPGTDITVTADSALEANTSFDATFGALTFAPTGPSAVLAVSGPEGQLSFDHTAITAPGTVGINAAVETLLTRTGGLDGNGQTATFVKTGAADVILNQEGVDLDNVTFDVQEGRLIGVHGSNPFLAAAMEINGGELVLASGGGNVEYNNQINATAGTLTAGAEGGGVGGVTIAVGSDTNDVTVAPGGLLRVQAMDGITLDIAGQTLGGDFKFERGSIELSGGGAVDRISVATAQVNVPSIAVAEQLALGSYNYDVAGGPLGVSSPDLLAGVDLTLGAPGAILTIANTAYGAGGDSGLEIYLHDTADGDGRVDPVPDSSTLTFEGILSSPPPNPDIPSNGDLDIGDFNFGNWSALTHDDSFSVLFEGVMVVGAEDDYTFGTASDDGSTFWIDLDRNGLYEHTGALGDEMIVDNKGAHGRQERMGGAHLTAGAYKIAVPFEERGGGDNIEGKWGQGAGLSYGALAFINPAGPFWTEVAPAPINAPNTNLDVTADAALALNSPLAATLGDVVLRNDATLTILPHAGLTVDDVSGNGSIVGDFLVGGEFHAGESPGLIVLDGNVAFLPGSIFYVDVEGLIPGDEYSQAVLLGGILDISNAALHVETTFTSGILPGDTLMLINNQGGTVVGNFLPGATVSDGNGVYLWDVVYQGDDVFLQNTYIPEPATLTLLGLGLLAARRRRRKR